MERGVLLVDFLVLLGVSIPISYVFNRLKIPAIVGFLVTGMIAGPSALGLISDSQAVQAMAEIGVVLLLFTIGLEFSLVQLIRMGFRILVIGVAQVVVTVAATQALTMAFQIPWREGLVIAFLVTLSSSAIVLKILSDRGESASPQGRIIVGISLTQDIGVIPMMMLIPALAGETFNPAGIARQLGLAVLTIAALVLVARYVVPRILEHVLHQRSRDLFLVTVIFIILGTAYASGSMGLSLAIGAFIAGLVISESQFSHQVISDIVPFRDLFSAVFFISVGMLLDVSALAQDWQLDSILTIAIIAGKAALILAILLIGRQTFRVSWIAAFSMAQVGEFSFLLAQQARQASLLRDAFYQPMLSASVLSMLLTPFVMIFAGPAAAALQRWFKVKEAPPEAQGEAMQDHLIIVGFGLNGRNLANVVRDVGIPFVVIELNADLFRQAQQENVPVVFGDATRREVLQQAGASRARAAVVAISDPRATRTAAAMLRSANPAAMILVRTRYVAEVESLQQLGANLVIPEEFETSVEIFARVLEHYRIPDHLIQQQVQVIRSGTYGMLRGLSLSQERLLKISELFLKSTVQQFVITPDSPAAGATIRELNLRGETGASILVVIRGDQANNNPDADFRLEAGDVIVLWGAHQQLSDAMRKLARMEASER